MTVSAIDLLLIAGRAVFLIFSFVLAAVTFVRWRRSSLAQTGQALAQHQIVLQRLAELEARVDATRVAISKLGERFERPQPLPSTANSAAPGYQIAIRLAKGGASREELISGCGLSIHEAELVHRLHAPPAGGGRPRPVSAQPAAA
jgi:alkylation response protein AidB-like acyl-CoA dehydrogenase